MKFTVNGLIIESADSSLAIESAIRSFGENPDIGDIREWAESVLLTWQTDNRNGISEIDYHEAAGWLADQNTTTWLSQKAEKLHQTTLDYANSIVATWEAAEKAYDLAVSLVEQANTVDDIKLILSRRM